MTTPRNLLVHPNKPYFYHLVSRCVRQAWLCGKRGGRDYSHRKTWLLDRIKQLCPCFALEVHAYAIMSNHFHLVVYFDPNASSEWSSQEVVDRWLTACPPKCRDGEINDKTLKALKVALLSEPDRVEQLRKSLGSISVFMKLLKQPIARRANLEDGCQGHFFEKRFYSGALLDEKAILAAMAYVDLNPLRAKLADSLETSEDTSIAERIRKGEFELGLQPITSGLRSRAPILQLTLASYVSHLRGVFEPAERSAELDDTIARWRQNVRLLSRPQRAYGTATNLRKWIDQRGLQLRESALS